MQLAERSEQFVTAEVECAASVLDSVLSVALSREPDFVEVCADDDSVFAREAELFRERCVH